MIELDCITKIYSSGSGVRNISVKWQSGINGFIGKNGAGKTTIMKLIMGLLAADSGDIVINGNSITRNRDKFRWRKDIGFCPSEDYFYGDLTGKDNLEYICLLRTGKKKLASAFVEMVERLEVDKYWRLPFSKYSSGMKKKVQLLASLIEEPNIVIWDEPINGVDIVASIEIRNMLLEMRKKGKVVLVSSHYPEFVDGILDSLAIIDNGAIISHTSDVPSNIGQAFITAIGMVETSRNEKPSDVT